VFGSAEEDAGRTDADPARCPACGEALTDVDDPSFCPDCGEPI
jgi:predicted Zn-ribbon and HTH transcriptional regulator